MAYYDYFCERCDITEEIEHDMVENPEIFCDECGSAMRRIITGVVPFHLKGQGWVSKGNGLASSPKHTTEIGIKVNESMAVPGLVNGAIGTHR